MFPSIPKIIEVEYFLFFFVDEGMDSNPSLVFHVRRPVRIRNAVSGVARDKLMKMTPSIP